MRAGQENSFYFAERFLSTLNRKMHIKVSDRATILTSWSRAQRLYHFLRDYTSELNDDKIIAIPLEVDDMMTLGYLMPLSR